jgi:hypothetical protein
MGCSKLRIGHFRIAPSVLQPRSFAHAIRQKPGIVELDDLIPIPDPDTSRARLLRDATFL